MNSQIAVAVGLAAVLAAVLVPISTPTPAYAADVPVSITQGSQTKTTDAYAPNPVEVSVGDTVIWTNDDSTLHTATAGVPAEATGMFGGTTESPVYLAPGQTQEFTFEEAGEFPYWCTLHPNMVGTVVVSAGTGNGGNGGTTPQPFTVTATADGTDYEVTGTSETATATAATINPGQSVEIEFDGAGIVELTLPKDMISNITSVNEENATIVSENDTHTTISFEIPEGETTATILAGFVVPEFPVIAAVLAASIAAIIGYSRFARSGTGFFGRA